jgi:hypothetical protein
VPSGYSFISWTGSGTGSYSGSSNPGSVTMDNAVTETATCTANIVYLCGSAVHSTTDCTKAGGVLYNTSSCYVCEYAGTSCSSMPSEEGSGWAQYQTYDATSSNVQYNGYCLQAGCVCPYPGGATYDPEDCPGGWNYKCGCTEQYMTGLACTCSGHTFSNAGDGVQTCVYGGACPGTSIGTGTCTPTVTAVGCT